MTHLDLIREARAIVPPVGADKAIALVDEQGHYRAAFLVNGRIRSAPVGPSFDKPRAACAFVDLLNGDDGPASRSSLDSDSAPRSGSASSGDAGGATSEAPEEAPGVSVQDPAVVAPAAAAGVRTCEICQAPLPAGSRSHRRTCSGACRRALARAEAGDVAKAQSAAETANRRAAAHGLPGRITRDDVLALWEHQPECVSCGQGRGIDHVTPMGVGGANDPENLQTMCRPCNTRKAAAERLSAGGAAEIRRRADARSGVPLSPAQRPSDAAAQDPTASEEARGPLLRASSRDAGPDLSGIADPAVPTLGL